MTGPVDDRFARSRLIEGWDPERLAAATAVVVGVGALGNEVAKNLALAGVGRLVLCDPDVVALSNLSRTVLFTEADVGRPKPLAAARALRRLAPDAELVPRERELVSAVGLGELADAGVVLGCLDSVHARMQLLGRCALTGAALVDGGTGPWTGEVRLRLDPEEPCYGCTLSHHERGVSDLPWSCADPPPAGPAAASIVSTSLVASWMTLAAIRVLLGTPPAFRLLRLDGLVGRAEVVTMRRDADCPHHHSLPAAEPVAVTHRDTVDTLLAALSVGADPIAWARVPLPLRCVRCGPYPVPPGTRRGSGEGIEVCPTCGTLVRQRFTERFRDVDGDLVLEDLGVAPEEILIVRLAGGGHGCRRLKRPGDDDQVTARPRSRASS